jgi:hypothetical protein
MAPGLVLAGDNWAGSVNQRWELVGPDFAAVADALSQLDGRIRTEVGVRRDEPFEYVSVAGGPELFVVTGELPDGSVVQMHSMDAVDGSVSLVCGGQRADYPLSDVVTQEDALDALRQFVEGNPQHLSERWTVQS